MKFCEPTFGVLHKLLFWNSVLVVFAGQETILPRKGTVVVVSIIIKEVQVIIVIIIVTVHTHRNTVSGRKGGAEGGSGALTRSRRV